MKNPSLATRCSLFVLLFGSLLPLAAQEKDTGPIIAGYGAVWDIPEADFPTPEGGPIRMVLDVMHSPGDKGQRNPWLETAARFLNMHARAGVPADQMHVALVVHNEAAPDLLDNPAYRERFGEDNPNAGLLEALMGAGAEIVLCGQSARSRDVPVEKTIPGVRLALSAMTALIHYQNQEYRLIKF